MNPIALRLLRPLPLEPRVVVLREELNTPFVAAVEVWSRDPSIDLDALIGQPAALDLVLSPSASRAVTGLVRSVSALSTATDGLSRYSLEIVPHLWLLGQRRRYRVFQCASELDVALSVFAEWKLRVEVRVDPKRHPRREQRVQYAESDLAFVDRLLEDAGVTYFFELHDGYSVLVVTDAPTLLDGPSRTARFVLPVHDQGTRAVGPWATDVAIRRRLAPGRYTLRDVDLRQPTERQPQATSTRADANAVEATLERFSFLPGAFHVEAPGGADTPVADERIATRALQSEGDARAARGLAAERASAKVLELECQGAGIAPGATVAVTGHPSRYLGVERPWLVVAASTTVTTNEQARVSLSAVPTDQPYAPPLRAPRPLADSVENGIVIARPGEEIDPNEHGAVRLHFPWDRGEATGGAWVSVSQPWAGQGFGVTNVPRHGHEVLVEYLSGTPDWPVVTGRVYNAVAPVPYALPAAKTQSGWRTNSTNNTGGFNELMMEDRSGDELVRMRAQRDLSTTTKRDETREVDNDRFTRVSNDESRLVKRNQSLSVDGNVQKSVLGSNDSLVGSDNTNLVAKSYNSSVSADRREGTTAATRSFIGYDDVLDVTGLHEVTAPTRAGFKVGGSSIEMAGGTITMQTAAGAKAVFTKSRIEITCDIFDAAATSILSYDPSFVSFNFDKLSVEGFAMCDVSAPMVLLNGGGRPFSRLLDSAPDKIANGAATVTVGK